MEINLITEPILILKFSCNDVVLLLNILSSKINDPNPLIDEFRVNLRETIVKEYANV